MPLNGNIPHDIKAERAAGKPEKQAIAIALAEKRRQDAKDMYDLLKKGKR
jgi:hypothetical protein